MNGLQQATVLIISLAACVSLSGCATEETGYPPVARIGASPTAIPENDNFQTEVTLDATMSADPIDDPQHQRPLRYRWQIIGDEFRLEDGTMSSETLTVTLLGERPATIQLTVIDVDGNESTAQEQLQLTVRP